MDITITDPDQIIRDNLHAIRFTTVYDEQQSSSNVIHLTTEELCQLAAAIHDRLWAPTPLDPDWDISDERPEGEGK